MALFGLGTRSTQPNRLGSIQVGTSEYGVARPIGWGNFKASLKLLDYQNFQAVGKSQGGKGGSISSYEYSAAVDGMLVVGPIGGIGNIYDSGGAAELLGAVETYTIPSGGGTYNVQNGGAAYWYDEGVTHQVNYTISANDFGSDGAITLTGYQPAPFEKVAGSPTALEYSVTSAGAYTFSGADAGTLVTITYAYTTADTTTTDTTADNTTIAPIQRYGFAVQLGSTPGSAWGYMLSNYPANALRYDGLARFNVQNMDLGSSATVPSISAEILNGRLKSFGNGVADCNLADILTDFLGDAVEGCNWPYLGDTTLLSNYCAANNLFMSPYLDSVQKATQIVKNWCDLTNCEPVWSGGTLDIIPYGDTSAVGNGRTFTPPTQPMYIINEADLVCGDGEEPCTFSWQDLADNYNRVRWEYSARNDNYDTAIIHQQDEASILMNGLLPMQTVTAHEYCVQLYAAIAMNMQLRRKATPLRIYRFKLKWYYDLIEPMKIIVVNLTTGGLGPTPMRVISKEEEDDYTLAIEAEDFLFGMAAGVEYPTGPNTGLGPAAHALPGATSLLAAFQPSVRVTGGSNQLWLALGGGPNWGGCRVWWSLDGATYSEIGEQYGSARAGTLTAALAAGADPDATDIASVTVAGSLATVSDADADSFATLCLLGTELISYASASLTASTATTNSYSLSYLRRGVFSSTLQAHSPGEVFVRLDNAVFQKGIDPSLIGKTVSLKFTSWNLYGQQEESLANVPAVRYVISAPLFASTMTVGSFINSDGTTTTVQVFLPGGSPSAYGTAALPNGATVRLPPYTWTSEGTSTQYYVNDNPSIGGTGGYVLYTDVDAWLADQHAGMIAIGTTLTPAAGSGGTFGFTQYSDTGSNPTSTPSGAYTSGSSATVSGSATWTPSGSNPSRGSASVANGNCTWSGVSGSSASIKTLRATISSSNSSFIDTTKVDTVSVTLDGSTWTTLFTNSSAGNTSSGVYSLSIPANTNFANVQVRASSSCTAPPGVSGGYKYATSSLTISNLMIS